MLSTGVVTGTYPLSQRHNSPSNRETERCEHLNEGVEIFSKSSSGNTERLLKSDHSWFCNLDDRPNSIETSHVHLIAWTVHRMSRREVLTWGRKMQDIHFHIDGLPVFGSLGSADKLLRRKLVAFSL
jgi:hypothetical protein